MRHARGWLELLPTHLEAMVSVLRAHAAVKRAPVARLLERGVVSRPRSAPNAASLEKARVLAAAVDRVSRRLPVDVSCLPRALAAQHLLARHGLDSTVEVGFLRGEGGELEGHAWLTYAGVVVLGSAPGFVAVEPGDSRSAQVTPETTAGS